MLSTQDMEQEIQNSEERANLFSVRLEKRVHLRLGSNVFDGWEVLVFFTALHIACNFYAVPRLHL